MSRMPALRALVAERLTAAAEEIAAAAERSVTSAGKKRMRMAEMSAEQQRADIHKRLMVVADEIFRILEMMMADCEADVSGSHREIDCERKLLDVTIKSDTHLHRADVPTLKQSSEESTHGKEASTETDFDSTEHIQRAEKGAWTEKSGDNDREAASSKHSAGCSEDKDSDTELDEELQSVKSKKRKAFERRRQSWDRCETCGRTLHKSFTLNNKQNNSRNTSGTVNKSHKPGQCCCRVCGKSFRYKRSFLKHVLKHEQSTNLCGVCGKHVDTDEGLKAHLQSHNEENSCRDHGVTDERPSEGDCSEAESKACESDEDWKETEGSESDDGDGGKQKRESETRLQESPTRLKNKECRDLSQLKFCCKVCGKSFCYRASFLKHVQEEERDTSLCGVCGKRFESEESLRLHLQTYIRTNECEVCGKHFDGHKQLEMHMRTHTGEKPYVCSVCGKAFAQNGNLMGHMRVHTGEKPYVCSVCGQSFSFKEYMMAHMRIHTGEKPFLCSVCGKGFRQRGTLKTHMMIHTGESTHRCGVCDKTFYKSGALKIHMRSHTGEKPYLCNVCGKCFTASGSLTKHMGVHHGERTHRCGVCAKGFLRREELKKHAQSHRDESTQLGTL